MRASLIFMLPLCVSMILAVCAVPLSSVSGPTNLSVSCHNLTNVLYWNDSTPVQPEFIVTIHSYSNGEKTTVRTNETFLDISEYTEGADDSFSVTVDAQPSNEGWEHNDLSAEGISFSYNEDFPVDVTCVVDFPVLEVSVLQHTVILSFTHPFYVHEDESFEGVFEYTIFYNATNEDCECSEDTVECRKEIHLYESLNGRCIDMFIKGTVNSIPMKISRRVCSDGAVSTDWVLVLTTAICSVFGLLLLMLLVFLIYKKFTQPDSESMIFAKLLKIVNSEHIINEPDAPVVSRVMTLVLDSPPDTSDDNSSDPSFTLLEEKPLVSSYPPTHLPIHFNDHAFPEEQDQGQMTNDADFVDIDSGNSFSGYDSCKFPIDMGQGDIVDAYGPR